MNKLMEAPKVVSEMIEKVEDVEMDQNYMIKPATSYQKTYCETYGKTDGGDSDLEAAL